MAIDIFETRTKPRAVLALIIAHPGINAAELCRNTHYTMASVQGCIVYLMHHGLVLRAYDTKPPCTYWATQKAIEMSADTDKETDT